MKLEISAHQPIESAARKSYGKLLAALSSRFRDIEACEDALSEAFKSASEHWVRGFVPENPEAWLYRAAINKLIDSKRKDKRSTSRAETIALLDAERSEQKRGLFPDERLKLLFVCCHPSIDEAVRTPLMLQTVLGMESAIIASAFLISPSAMMKKLVRAKQKIKLAKIAFQIPEIDQLPSRLGFVAESIFALYGKAWDSLGSPVPNSTELGDEAIYLAELLVDLLPEEPEPKGLLAMILFCESRKRARRSREGAYILLDEQNVDDWNSEQFARAESLLSEAFLSKKMGRFQMEAAIQSAHGARILHKLMNWREIYTLYQGLIAHAPTIGAFVCRANALAEIEGASEGLNALDQLPRELTVSYQPYWALRALLLSKLQKTSEAGSAYEIAIGLSQDQSVRLFLQKMKNQIR